MTSFFQVFPMKKYICRPFTLDEDVQLRSLVERHGANEWAYIASMMEGRTPKECKQRFNFYLSNYSVSVPWSFEEDALLYSILDRYGKSWPKIAHTITWRTREEIKLHVRKIEREKQLLKDGKIYEKKENDHSQNLSKIDPLLLYPWAKDPPNQMFSDIHSSLSHFLDEMISRTSTIFNPNVFE